MTSPFDDPVYANVQALREPGALAARIAMAWSRECPDRSPGKLAVKILQTHFKPRTRARLLLSVKYNRATRSGKRARQWLFAQVYADLDAARRRLTAAGDKHALRSSAPPVLLIEEWNTVVWALPNGPQLRPLKVLLRRKKFARFLQEFAMQEAGAAPITHKPKLLRYVPRRRAVVRWRDDAVPPRVIFFKGYGPGKDEIAATNLRLINATADAGCLQFTVPRLMLHSARRRIIAMSEVPGTPLSQQLSTADPVLFARVGVVLASLHITESCPLQHWTAQGELRGLQAAMLDVKLALPHMVGRIDAIVERLAGQLRVLPFQSDSVIHGNMFGDQILVDRTSIGIVDWDDLSLGDGLYDVGRLIAHVIFMTGRPELDAWHLSAGLSAMLGAYEQTAQRPVDAERLRWHTAAALLFRAKITALRTLGPSWNQRIAACVDEVERILDRSSHWICLQTPTRTPGTHEQAARDHLRSVS